MKIGNYETHPATDVFPMMTGAEFQALVDDIAKHGLREPITRYQHERKTFLLDGRNRLRACMEVGIKPEWEDYNGDDPVAFVVSLNLARRHLNESQRSLIGARLANMERGRPSTEKASNEALSQEQAAERLNVSRSSIQRARKVLDHGAPETVEAVDAGELEVSAAAEISDLDHADQVAIVQMVSAGEATNVRQARRKLEEEKRAAVRAPENADCRVILGDCVAQVMALTERPHLVVADPPYGIDVHNTRRGEKDYADGADYAFDLLERLCLALRQKLDDSAHLYFCSGYTHAWRVRTLLEKHFEVQENPLIWAKNNHTMCDFSKWYPSKHEYVWFCKMPGSTRALAKCIGDVLPFARENETTHSAEKPTDLLALLIEQSSVPGELVLDPFCGSGATGVAASRLARSFIGIESESHWVEVARARLAAGCANGA